MLEKVRRWSRKVYMERWHLNSDLKTEDTAKIPWKEKNFGLFEGKKMRSVWQVISAENISYPDLLPTRKKKRENSIKNIKETWTVTLQKRQSKWPINMKRSSNHRTLTSEANVKKTDNAKWWQGYKQTGTVIHSWLGWQLVWPWVNLLFIIY